MLSFFFLFFNYYLFIWLSRALVAACGSLTRDRTQAAEPPAKSQAASSYDFIHPIFHSSINPFLRPYVLVTSKIIIPLMYIEMIYLSILKIFVFFSLLEYPAPLSHPAVQIQRVPQMSPPPFKHNHYFADSQIYIFNHYSPCISDLYRNVSSIPVFVFYCCCSITNLCPVFLDSMDCCMSGFSVSHHLLEFAQVHVYWISDAIQPSHPLSPPSFVFSLSQHQGLFHLVGCLHQVAKVLELQLQHQSFQWVFRVDFL